ncbi:hypothetical protein ES707_19297 [subsurface metagenome]
MLDYFLQRTKKKIDQLMKSVKNYNYKKKNLPHRKTIIDFKDNYIIFIPNDELLRINIKKRPNKILRIFKKRKLSHKFEKFIEERINKLSEQETIRKLQRIYVHSEIILLPDYKAITILKSTEFTISIERILEILKDLKNSVQYYACYGLDLVGHSKRNEFIDLQDFNFKFHTEDDLRYCIKIIQNLDSEGYQFHKKKSIFILREGFLDTLRNKRFIKDGEEIYIYLDVEDFTIWNKFASNYPDITEEIIENFLK